MAKTLTVHKYDKVVNVTATLQTGGSLSPNTTYYVRVYATDSTERIQGEISDEISFTTTTTELSATISWDAVPDAPYYAVLQRPETQSSYDFYGAFQRGPNNNLYYTTDQTSYLFDGTNPGYYTMHPFNCPYDFPLGLNKNKGRLKIEISGSSDSDYVTLEDLRDAVIGAGLSSDYYYDDGGAFGLLANITFSGVGNRMYVDSPANTRLFIVIAGFFDYENGSSDNNVYFGYETTDQYPIKILFLPHGFIRPSFSESNRQIHFSNVQLDFVNKYSSTSVGFYPMIDYGGLHFKNTFIYTHGWSWSPRSQDCNMQNSFTNNTANFNLYSFDNQITNVLDNRFFNLDCIGAYDGLRIFRNEVYDYFSGNAQIRVGSYTQGGSGTGDDGLRRYYLRDVTFTTTTNNIPTPYYYATNQNLLYPTIYCETTKKIKVIDNDGNIIEGASVELSSQYETLNETTDANGEVELYPVFGAAINDWTVTDPDSLYCRKETYEPFTVKITKSGYEDYEDLYVDVVKFQEVESVTLTLKSIVPVRPTTSGTDAIAVQPQLGSNSLLEIN